MKIFNVEYTYGDGTHALKGINLKIEKGKKLLLLESTVLVSLHSF